MHTPVLLPEVCTYLDVREGEQYIDATFGEGGHSKEILRRGGRVLAFEWDKQNYLRKKEENTNVSNLVLVNANFADMEKVAAQEGFKNVSGVLFDLGISMEQIAMSKRGFSFRNENESLDMRISDELDISAADILNTWSESEIADIFAHNAEEIFAVEIAKEIIEKRKKKKIENVGDLTSALEALGKGDLESIKRRVFQALRIEVNHEFENLEKGLNGAMDVVSPGGRILIITFHSVEDRIVKKFVTERNLKFVTKKPITTYRPNTFEKTAKLRVIQKI